MKDEFEDIVSDLVNNSVVLEMKKYRQHFDVDCFSHCYDVSYCCYAITKKLGLDYKAAARAGMLHDFFLYDWRVKNDYKGLHAFTHGKIACENSLKLFNLTKKEQDMIIKHMWPVTIVPPKSIEGFILTLADKYCASKEILKHLANVISRKEVVKYAGVVFHLLIMNIK